MEKIFFQGKICTVLYHEKLPFLLAGRPKLHRYILFFAGVNMLKYFYPVDENLQKADTAIL